MGVARLGRLIQFIPHPVTTGFTAGIAIVIATLQLKDVSRARRRGRMPEHYVEKVGALWERARRPRALAELGVAAATLALLLLRPARHQDACRRRWSRSRSSPSSPRSLHRFVAGVRGRHDRHALPHDVDGVTSRASRASRRCPRCRGARALRRSRMITRAHAAAAFAIAMLGAIESLLSAVVADGMTGTKHDPNAELVALGIGNIVAPFFGGIAATGALARTATNIRAGARSPLAAVIHAVLVLLVDPAARAARRATCRWRRSRRCSCSSPGTCRRCATSLHLVRVAPKSDVLVLLTCFVLTVVFDMVVAVSVGFVLAALLFMRRMAELTESRLAARRRRRSAPIDGCPRASLLYEIAGPLFFGAAQNAMATLGAVRGETFRVLVAPPRARARHRRDRPRRARERHRSVVRQREAGRARRTAAASRARSSTRRGSRRNIRSCAWPTASTQRSRLPRSSSPSAPLARLIQDTSADTLEHEERGVRSTRTAH